MQLARLLECQEQHGVIFGNDDLSEISTYLAQHFSGFDFLRLAQHVAGFADHHGLEFDYVAAGVSRQEFRMEWVAPEDSIFNFLLTRTLLLRDEMRIAFHDLFVLPPRLQGQGLAKVILRAFYEQYLAARIDRIELVAGKFVGGYAWAVYGFHATDPQQVLDIIERGRARPNITFDETELHLMLFYGYYSTNPPATAFPMRELATSPGGKALLQDTEWNGMLDLRNDLQRELFETYLGSVY